MKKKILALSLGLMIVLSLGACGTDPDQIWYGVVSSGTSVSQNTAIPEIGAGVTAYGQETGHKIKTYTVSGNSAKAYEKTFNEAAKKDKVKVLVSAGKELEIPLYQAQKKHKKTKFVLFDGQPRKEEGGNAGIRKNTLSVRFDQEDIGFMAGYTAVRVGYHTVGYIGGKQTASSKRYLKGFTEGMDYAAKEAGMTKNSVVLNYEYAGSDQLIPLRMTDAMKFYQNGVELIVTDQESLLPALVKAAGISRKMVATIGFTASEPSGNILYSTEADYSGAAAAALKRADDKLDGGQTETFGFKESAVRLNCDFARMTNFSKQEYQKFLASAKDGFAVKDDEKQDPILLTNEVQPTAPDPSAGLEAASNAGGGTESQAAAGQADSAAAPAASGKAVIEEDTDDTDQSQSSQTASLAPVVDVG